MKTTEHPKVFISHASEDKDRFVVDFATKLRSNGVDAWVDQWEINIGDSLIDKIFEQGIAEADVFIIILSTHSIQKPWVKEELNAGAIKRIEKNTKILPIIIDQGVDVPEVLKSIVWEVINDLKNYEDQFKRILASVFGMYEKPAIGQKPPYAVETIQVTGLNQLDSSIFQAIGHEIIASGDEFIESGALNKIIENLNISENEILDALDVFEHDYLIKLTKFIGPELPLVQFTYYGILKYAEHCLSNFPDIYKHLISFMMNEDMQYSREYAIKIGCSKIITDALLQYFENNGHIKTHNTMNAGIGIYEITGVGKRFFREQLEAVIND
jgi:hypothetical protein